jgi:predicted component of viral defense system (DUF524 family)
MTIKKITIYSNNRLLLSVNSFSCNFLPTIDTKETKVGELTYKYELCDSDYKDISFNESEVVAIKLYENSKYWFEFFNISIDVNQNILNKLLENPLIDNIKNAVVGNYTSNNYVGILNLETLGITENYIEVESRKIDYKNDFSKLVEDLSENIIDLISRDSSFHQSMISKTSKVNEKKENLYSSFAYIKSFLYFDKMPMYLLFLMKNPYTKTMEINEEQFIWESDEIDIDNLIYAYQDESNLFQFNNTHLTVDKIPIVLNGKNYESTIDTFENQFIKYILELLYDYLYSIQKDSLGDKLKWEIEQSMAIVSQYLESPFFSKISKLKYFSLNSKVLQRRYPYNKFLQFYFSWDMSSSVFFDIYDEMFCMGQKDVPTMYEYFCFITFVKELDNRYSRDNLINNELVVYQNNTFNFKLKSGKRSELKYSIGEDKYLKLFYNKEYNSAKYIVSGRSYSNSLTPDISLELFNDDRLIGIIHFDAKYKVTMNNDFKVEDLNKMHTYKDAIMGTLASYILYPGMKEKVFKQEEYGFNSEEVVFPSVGACPLSITTESKELAYIFSIIDNFIELLDSKNGLYTIPPVNYDGITKIIG